MPSRRARYAPTTPVPKIRSSVGKVPRRLPISMRRPNSTTGITMNIDSKMPNIFMSCIDAQSLQTIEAFERCLKWLGHFDMIVL